MAPESVTVPQGAPSQGKNRGSRLALVVLLGIALVVIVWALTSRSSEKLEIIAPGEEKRTAPQGSLVSNFPQELILEAEAPVDTSYGIEYTASGIDQPVARYRSAKTLEENIVAFREYLGANGWTVIREADPTESPTFFYAKKDTAEVNITFINNAGSIVVNIAYASKLLP